MIRRLSGKLTEVKEQSVVLEVRGIGYLIHTDAFRHALEPGGEHTFHTHLAVRENALDLYGFSNELALQFFELLLSVPKIGPRSALQIMCQCDLNTLAVAIKKQDAGYLSKLSGVGKKTAESLVLSLKSAPEKTPHLFSETEAGNSSTNINQDALDALMALGFSQEEARLAVTQAPPEADTTQIIKMALKK